MVASVAVPRVVTFAHDVLLGTLPACQAGSERLGSKASECGALAAGNEKLGVTAARACAEKLANSSKLKIAIRIFCITLVGASAPMRSRHPRGREGRDKILSGDGA